MPPQEELAQVYTSVEQVGITSCRFCVDYENEAPILVARGLKVPLVEVWPQVKHYD